MKEIKDVLQRVVVRSEMQNQIHVEEMRAKLFELGYSVVTSVWLNDVLSDSRLVLVREKAGEVVE